MNVYDRQVTVVLIGNGTAAVRALQELLALGVQVPLILADYRDTGEDSWRLSLKKCARCAGYLEGKNIFSPRDPNAAECLDAIRAASADVILSVQCARILRSPMYGLARRGVVNLHNAPLPLLRGCDPFAWAIHDGLLEMGVTLHQVLDEGVDNGPILAQRRWAISADATAWDLYCRALDEGALLIRQAITDIARGTVKPLAQDPRFVTYHPLGQFDYSDLQIQWNMVAATLSAWIRSRVFPPLQLPYFLCNDDKVPVLRCRAHPRRGKPGEILEVGPLIVAARWGSIEIIEIACKNGAKTGKQFASEVGLRPGMQIGGDI